MDDGFKSINDLLNIEFPEEVDLFQVATSLISSLKGEENEITGPYLTFYNTVKGSKKFSVDDVRMLMAVYTKVKGAYETE